MLESSGPLPPDFACTACGYDMANGPVWRCPECGRPVEPQDLARHDRWREAERTWRNRAVRTFGGATIGALLTALAVGFASRVWDGTGILFVVCLAAIVIHAVIGHGLILWLARPRERAAWFRVFAASGWWVHGPWLCIPGCTLILLAIAMLAPAGSRNDAITGGAMVGFACWVFWSILCLAWALYKLDRHATRWGVGDRRAPLGALAVLSVLSIAPTALIGLIAGAGVVTGFERWFS